MPELFAQTPAPTGLPSDQVLAFVLLGIVIIVVAARLVGALFVRLGQPRVVGEIVAGVLLGPSLFGPARFGWDAPWGVLACDRALTAPPGGEPSVTTCLFPPQARSVLGIVGQLALILFMFLVGLQLDLNQLRGRVRGVVGVGVGVVVVPVAAAFAIAPVLYNDTFVGGFGTDAQPTRLAFTLMVGAMLSVTAFPVAARILQEKRLDQTDMGAIGIAAAALVTVLMFLVVGVARGVAADAGTAAQVWRLVGTVVFLVVMFAGVRPLLARLAPAVRSGAGLSAEHLAIAISVLFASAYAADRIGVNVIVGGFVAGVVMPARERLAPELATRLTDLTVTVLLPVFLAFSGLQTDFNKLGWDTVGGLALFIAVGIAAKWIGGMLFARLGGLSWAEGNAIGVLMNCRGLLVLVVALIGLNQGVISPQLQVGGVLMALITTAMTGPLIDRFLVPAPAPVLAPAGGNGPVRPNPHRAKQRKRKSRR
jgi:Kef-type K+ transport system membrane component KefB